MRFLSMIRIDETTGQAPSEQLMADMGRLIEELTRTGQLVSTAGLRPTSEGVRADAVAFAQKKYAELAQLARQRAAAGIEGRIHVLQRDYGLARCRDHGAVGMGRWVGWGVVVHNLAQIARSQAWRQARANRRAA